MAGSHRLLPLPFLGLQEEELFDQVATCVGTFLKKGGDAVLPFVEGIMGQIAPLLDKSRSPEERRIAVCVVDDLLEHSSAGRAKYALQVRGMSAWHAAHSPLSCRFAPLLTSLIYG